MIRLSLLCVPLLVACQGEIGINELPDDPIEEEDVVDPAIYDGAVFRILSPASADFLAFGESHGFEAELLSADGDPLEFDEVTWVSGADQAWTPLGMTFDDDSIDVGIHDITAQVALPNGDRLAHTVGGVLVQHELAGTYVGTFQTSLTFQNFPIACAGSTVLIVEPYGQDVTGDATCIASAAGFDIPMDFTVEAANEEGDVTGSATGRIIAFDVDFDAVGSLPGDESLNLAFEGDVFGNKMTGKISTERISRDAGL